MIRKIWLKKFAAIFLLTAISFNVVPVNASSFSNPDSNMVGVIPVETELWNRLFGRRNNSGNADPGLTVQNNNNVFIENYSRLVDNPLYTLLRLFTDRVGLERNENDVTHVYVFNGNNLAINFAERINGLMNRIDANLAGLYLDAIRASRDINEQALRGHTAEMETVNREISQLSEELNNLPENRPTEGDFNAGRCVDSGLDDH